MNNDVGKPIATYSLYTMLQSYLFPTAETTQIEIGAEWDKGIAWDNCLLTGNLTVDMQHQRIFALVSDLVRFCEEGSDTAKLSNTLGFLVKHTIEHFSDEEALQIEYKYPDHENHKQKHNEFKETIDELVQRFEKTGSSEELSRNVNKILVRWLVTHIQQEDKKISEHIRIVSAK